MVTQLPKKMFGYKTEQEIHAQCNLNVRRILKTPQNAEKTYANL